MQFANPTFHSSLWEGLLRYFRLLSLLLLLALFLATFVVSQDEPSQKSREIGNLLRSGEFAKAETMARQCLRQVPDDIYFLSQLEMSLNGQQKYGEADEVAARVREIWKSDYKEEWIKRGSPVAESSWARVIITSKNYYVIGTEYFMPHNLGGVPTEKDKEFALIANFKIIATPKREDGRSRIFMLDKAISEKNYFLEEFAGKAIVMVASHGGREPDIRVLAKTVVNYLDRDSSDH